MTIHPRTRRRATAAAVAVGLALTTLAACGDDDDGDDAAAEATATSGVAGPSDGPEGDQFCEGFLGIEEAFAEAPEDEAEIPAFVEERIEPNLALIEGNEPADIAEEVQTLTGAVEQVAATGDFAAFETPEFSAASAVVYTALDDTCDVEVVEFDAVDFGYEGVPDTLEAGPTSFVMTNESAAGEAHEFSLVRLRDDVDLPLEEILALPEAEADQLIDAFAGATFAPAGATAGNVTDLTPGRYLYVCFIPVGSVDGTEGSGPPHAVEGMAGELIVD